MPISDTSPEIEAMQMQIRRRMTMDDRFQVAIELSDLCRELRKAGIKREHPDWSERDVVIELFRLAFFPEPLPAWVREFRQSFPRDYYRIRTGSYSLHADWLIRQQFIWDSEGHTGHRFSDCGNAGAASGS